jgi:L-lactate dehydrogenase complex protein LldG
MADSQAARDVVLGRVRAAVGSSTVEAVAAAWAGIRREYVRVGGLGYEERLELLEDRLRDYDAGVYRVARDGVREAIGRILETRGKRKMVVDAGFPREWMPAGVRFVEDSGESVAGLDACDGVLTTATLAIAETGTIVLQNAPGQGRRALTLVPDYHLCVVEAATVVESVPEAFARLDATSGKATTFFSGPSATADIEMTRIKGVHGPRFVDVVLVG